MKGRFRPCRWLQANAMLSRSPRLSKFTARAVPLLFALMIGCTASTISPRKSRSEDRKDRSQIASVGRPYQGWIYLAQKLLADGIPEREVQRVLEDPRMPPFSEIPFSLRPKESAGLYSGFGTAKHVELGRAFLRRHNETFSQAERAFGVPKEPIAAILFLETQFGKYTGKETVLYRLARIASVRDPRNLQLNYKRLQDLDPNTTFEEVNSRSQYLEKTFYPEVVALFRIARTRQMDIFSVKGSTAGAFGIPQFLPLSYLKFGVDGNKNGEISLFEEEDAIFSVAYFLAAHGWKAKSSLVERRAALYGYNKSEAYIDTVLKLAARFTQVAASPGGAVKKAVTSPRKKSLGGGNG